MVDTKYRLAQRHESLHDLVRGLPFQHEEMKEVERDLRERGEIDEPIFNESPSMRRIRRMK